MSTNRLLTFSQTALAGLLVVWLSGIVFLVCCERFGVEASAAESCPMAAMAGHTSDAEHEEVKRDFAERSEKDCMDCCGFLAAVFDKSRKLERAQKQAAVASVPTTINFRVPGDPAGPETIRAIYTRLPDKQRTFIKNRVLRI